MAENSQIRRYRCKQYEFWWVFQRDRLDRSQRSLN